MEEGLQKHPAVAGCRESSSAMPFSSAHPPLKHWMLERPSTTISALDKQLQDAYESIFCALHVVHNKSVKLKVEDCG